MLEFEDTLDEIVETLEPLEGLDVYKYNKAQIYKMSKKLGIEEIRQPHKKSEMIAMLNKRLYDRQEERKKLVEEVGKTNQEIALVDLSLNGVLIATRPEDGFVNATALCKAGGKRFTNWFQNDKTKTFIQALEDNTGIPASQLLDVKKGNSSQFSQGSWIHPDLAIQLAQWISPIFALQVSRWVRELAITGKVVAGHERSEQQLLELKRQLDKERDDGKKLAHKHKGLLLRRTYHKFEKGPVLYVVSDPNNTTKKFKVGIADDFNERLGQYRTSIPEVRAEFLMYVEKNWVIEEVLLSRFQQQRKPYLNHEWVYDLELSDIVTATKTISEFMGVEHTISSVEEYNQK